MRDLEHLFGDLRIGCPFAHAPWPAFGIFESIFATPKHTLFSGLRPIQALVNDAI